MIDARRLGGAGVGYEVVALAIVLFICVRGRGMDRAPLEDFCVCWLCVIVKTKFFRIFQIKLTHSIS